MSDLTDLIESQTAALFCDATSDLSTQVSVSIPGHAGTFTAYVLFGDPPETIVPQQGDQVKLRRARALGLVSALTTGCTALAGSARVIRKDDVLTVASGAYAGAWTVTGATPDTGGGVQLDLVLATRSTTAAPGIRV